MSSNIIKKEITCTAPVNIAVVKYWGKRDEKLILPTNSSLSGTLSQDQLQTRTTIAVSSEFTQDRLWLNGKEEDVANSKRLQNCLKETRKLRKEFEDSHPEAEKLSTLNVHACSVNNFPTAAGLASSASGYACFVFTLCKLFDLPISLEEMSKIARVGSGSACRSLFGGFVAWEMGEKEDGSDSRAVQIAPETHWPEIEALILVVSDAKKATSSTVGMQTTVNTSPLLQHRIKNVVPERMEQMKKAILDRDFESFALLTMQDSNQFHAVCLDTYPPISYMNDVSRAIVRLVTEFNKGPNGVRVAYTYDAGPNAVLYASREAIKEIIPIIAHFFPGSVPETYFKDPYQLYSNSQEWSTFSADQVPESISKVIDTFPADSIKNILHTKLGDGPRVADASVTLLGQDGLPLN
jgi:diphosphomevalonate decarboxylase